MRGIFRPYKLLDVWLQMFLMNMGYKGFKHRLNAIEDSQLMQFTLNAAFTRSLFIHSLTWIQFVSSMTISHVTCFQEFLLKSFEFLKTLILFFILKYFFLNLLCSKYFFKHFFK